LRDLIELKEKQVELYESLVCTLKLEINLSSKLSDAKAKNTPITLFSASSHQERVDDKKA
jgi:hypothetical protein